MDFLQAVGTRRRLPHPGSILLIDHVGHGEVRLFAGSVAGPAATVLKKNEKNEEKILDKSVAADSH
jgi:hypothetical protein